MLTAMTGRRTTTLAAVGAVAVVVVAGVVVVTTAVGATHGNAAAARTASSWTPPLAALHAEPDPVAGGRIVDARGREVLLRGVNVNALVDYWRYGAKPTTSALTDDDVDAIAAIGWDAVRLLVSWSRIEPRPGHYDEHYLDEVQRTVERFGRRGVYTIVDFHQDAWGPTLAAPPGTECPDGSQPAFGWDGAPGWATLASGASRCAPAGVRELSPAVQAAFTAFWHDAPGPGALGIQTRYLRMLEHVSGRFAGHADVAGFDVMNEPNAFTPDDIAALGAFEQRAVTAVRRGEAQSHEPRHLVLFEPAIPWSDGGIGTPPAFAHDRDVVFAPHIYRGGFTRGPVVPADFDRARADAATFGGVPVLIGEWGTSPARATDPADTYFPDHQRLQDEHRMSATLWTWRESCGDPHKAVDARAGRVPEVWGELDVDCRTDTVHGPRTALVDELRRAYVRAAPGHLTDTSYEPTTGTLHARGVAARHGSALVTFSPGPVTADALHATGLRAVEVRPSSTGHGSFVTGTATGGPWALDIDTQSR
jgi:endoglycosylceramidase